MKTRSNAGIHDSLQPGKEGVLSWLHFGDLHITSAQEQNYGISWSSSKTPKDSEDSVSVLVNRSGDYELLSRQIGDNSNAIGAYTSKGILGTQLGPNKNGRKW